jgi:hypothetical protein
MKKTLCSRDTKDLLIWKDKKNKMNNKTFYLMIIELTLR